MSRGKRLNIQGLARSAKELMTHIVPDEGQIYVSIDFASGEPTITSELSKDPNYIYACFGGVGKEPFYKDGLLYCDDIYVMNMSKSPLHAELVRKTFDEGQFDGRNFREQWLIDKEVITKQTLKKARDVEKMLCLALGYGMQPKKMVKQCYERGFSITPQQARAFYDSYWRTFSDVRKFADYCALKAKKDGYLINHFGYRLTCAPRLAYNYVIQSSVSGAIHVLIMKLFSIAKYSKLITIIHDELICSCPIERLRDFKKDLDLATESLNSDLGWQMKIRTGFAPGSTLYHAK